MGRRTSSFTFRAAKEQGIPHINRFNWQPLVIILLIVNQLRVPHVHSLFLSIAGCSGLESTIAFGGDVWRFVVIPPAPSKLKLSTICKRGGSLPIWGCLKDDGDLSRPVMEGERIST